MQTKLLLVNPKFSESLWGFNSIEHLVGVRYGFMPIALPTIAALTPQAWSIQAVDENIEPIDFDTPCDLIGLTAFNIQKTRAFEIAAEFKRRGKLVAMGGPFATSEPDLCQQHVDIVFLGEAERTWPAFCRSFEAGDYVARYTADEKIDMRESPTPLFHLLKAGLYGSGCIQTSRGCPFNCEFCDVIVIDGQRMRTKDIDAVIEEVKALVNLGAISIFFTDANFIGKIPRAKELLRALADYNRSIGFRINFSTEVTINVAQDDELLDLLRAANFTLLYIGIESPNVASLCETRKLQNTKHSLLDQVRKVQNKGIIVWAGMIVGFDNDTTHIFQAQHDFLNLSNIPISSLGPLVALPKTPLYKRLAEENRLLLQEEIPANGENALVNNGIFTNFAPMQMTQEELLTGYQWMLKSFYKYPGFALRLKNLILTMGACGYERMAGLLKWRDVKSLFKILTFFTFTANAARRRAFWSVFITALRKRPDMLFIVFSQFVQHAHIYELVKKNYDDPEQVSDSSPFANAP
jgi:radical SAM superfamily enzyme YgiQ (UPF0313 family)